MAQQIEISYVIRAKVLGISVQQLFAYDKLLEKGVPKEDALAAVKGQLDSESEGGLVRAHA